MDPAIERTRGVRCVATRRAMVRCPKASELSAGSRHREIAFGLLRARGTGGNLTTDAQIADHAIEDGREDHAKDPNVARFEGLRVLNLRI